MPTPGTPPIPRRSATMLLPALLFQLTVASAEPARTVERAAPVNETRRTTAPQRYRPAKAQLAPQIDGRSDDPVWKTGMTITEFRQFDPAEDGEPTFKTEVRLAYDSRNLYILARMYDPRPDSILSVLQRRDGFSLSDDIVVGIDSYDDKRTGYMFRLNAAGTMADGYIFNDGEEDWGWNAVWEGAARVD